MNLRSLFGLRRASDVLGKVREVATALAFAGGRLTPLSGIGIAAHLAAFLVGLAGRDLARVAADWPRLTVAAELHRMLRDALFASVRHRDDAWLHCVVGGQSVLVSMGSDDVSGTFYVEQDVDAVLRHIRETTWRRLGTRATLLPVGRWGDSVGLQPSKAAPAIDSDRAREVWGRIAAMVRAGEPRAVLLDGVPRTGKSTIARHVLALAEAELGQPLRVLRIAVSDFAYLTPSVVESAVSLLQPDALFLDDIDRFAGGDQLLDLFESVRATTRIVIATSNDSRRLPLALRLPGRIDEVVTVDGAGEALAASVLGAAWGALADEHQRLVGAWPVALIRELRLRLAHLVDADLIDEIDSLQARAAETMGPQQRAESAEPRSTASRRV